MNHFDGCAVFRSNHIRGHDKLVDRRFNTWTLNYAHSGSLFWSVDGSGPRILTGPTAYWTWPGPHYRYWPATEEGWDHYYVSWYGRRALSWQASGLHPLCQPEAALRLVTNPTIFRSAFEVFQTALDSFAQDDPQVVHLLEGLLLQLHTQRAKPMAEHSTEQRVKAIVEAVRGDPLREWDFAPEANHAGCTLTHFRRVWKTATGLSPISYLNKCRMDRAADMLRQGDVRLEEIAEAVCVSDPCYFSRLFRQYYSMPPGIYREAYRSME